MDLLDSRFVIGLLTVVGVTWMALWLPSQIASKVFVLLLMTALGAVGLLIDSSQRADDRKAQEFTESAQAQLERDRVGQIEQLSEQLAAEAATTNRLVASLATKTLPLPPTLMLHDVYGESWGRRQPKNAPLNLETTSPHHIPVDMWHRIDPCVMPPESLSNVWISLVFPPSVEVRIDKRLWQEWNEGANRKYTSGFGSLDPNPGDCAVKGMQDGSGGVPMEFRLTQRGAVPVEYFVTGRVAQTNVSLSGERRRFTVSTE